MIKTILELILFFAFCVMIYYAFWFGCLIDDVCFANNFIENI
jgi:hypothetical protein